MTTAQWRFAAGLRQDVLYPVSPTIVYLTKLYASGNTGSYRGQFRVERFFQEGDALGLTVQAALSDPLSTLVTGGAGRITEDNGWPNVETRIELGIGPRGEIRGGQTYFVNPVWELSKTAQVSLELDYRQTDYTQFQPNALLDSDALIVASRFLWRF